MKHPTVLIPRTPLLIAVGMILFTHLCDARSDSLELPQATQTVAQESKNPTAPYCGIQAVCLAARAINKEVDFCQMVQSQYIGSKEGSTLSELQFLCDALQLTCSETVIPAQGGNPEKQG